MIKFYYHGGSGNHGCEAIVRSTKKILDEPCQLLSKCPEEDRNYGIDQIADIIYDEETPLKRGSFEWFISSVQIKLTGSTVRNTRFRRRRLLEQVQPNDICLSIGGDNYCYTGVEQLSNLNQLIKQKGAKTVLWGCSIEPDVLTPEVIKDLKRYDLITVRESLSRDALLDAGVRDNVKLYSDPAFQLDQIRLPLPEGFAEGNTVGINISPLIMSCEESEGQAFLNYVRLIEWIIAETDMRIALIPHVVKPETDDRIPLQALYDRFQNTGRVCLIDDHNCMELKGFISRCRFFVGARTHATIAAYSTCVPTLVVGYSIKAKGIAKDIFGTYENYVLPVQALEQESDLTNAFQWLMCHERQMKAHLADTIPEYCKSALSAGEAVRRLMK